MPPQPTAAAPGPGSGTSSTDAVAAAIAQAKKEKRAAAAAAAMAPRMQSQVQKWAKMTAELGGREREGGGAGTASEGEGGVGDEEGDGATRPKKRTKIGADTRSTRRAASKGKAKQKYNADREALLPYAKQLRAPHRRDRYISFGVGRGLGKAADKSKLGTPSALPPTCLLCLVRFESRQQLRDHESLSAQHKRRLRDGEARKAAFRRYAKVEGPANPAPAPESDGAAAPVRPPVHTKRIPRRRGDLAPTYTSYAAVVHPVGGSASDTSDAGKYHACLLCRRRFRRLATLRLHERESALHRARTRVPELVTAAVAAVQEAKRERENTRPLLKMRPSQTSGTTQYRDRARERRLAFGNRPAGTGSRDKDKDDAVFGGAAAPASAPAAASKGAALLSKMGWSAGQGLGVQGGGLTEAIAPSAYRTGVGLGAQGGKMGDAAEVAARRTEADGGGRNAGSSYADFVEQAQEAARQRYKELDRAEAEAAAAVAAAAAGAGAAEADAAGDKMEED